MHLFNWLDIRTLIAAQLPVAAAFACVLFTVRRVYPNPRGSDSMALGMAMWIPATLLLLGQGFMPAFASSAIANLLVLGSYIFLYRGLLACCHCKGMLALVYDAAAVAAAVVIYFSTIYDVMIPRLVAVSVVVALVRALMAVELYRKANKQTPMLLLAGLMSFLALLPLVMAALAVMPVAMWASVTGTQVAGAAMHSVAWPVALQNFKTIADLVFLGANGLFAFSFFLGEIRETLQREGQYDGITGTFNAKAIKDALSVEVARSSRTHSPVSVMVIEIDRFKAINETYGHDRGDESLRTVVATVASILRFYDKCGRLATDKFLVILPENTAEHAMVIASRFRDALKNPALPADQPAITLSIGVTQCAHRELSADVLARAELALVDVRRNGRNGAVLKLPNHDNVPTVHPDRIANRSRVAKLTQ